MNGERLLSRAEVAEYLNIPPRTLSTWAHKDSGPPYFKIGKHVRYRPMDVEEWLAERRHVSAGRWGR